MSRRSEVPRGTLPPKDTRRDIQTPGAHHGLVPLDPSGAVLGWAGRLRCCLGRLVRPACLLGTYSADLRSRPGNPRPVLQQHALCIPGPVWVLSCPPICQSVSTVVTQLTSPEEVYLSLHIHYLHLHIHLYLYLYLYLSTQSDSPSSASLWQSEPRYRTEYSVPQPV